MSRSTPLKRIGFGIALIACALVTNSFERESIGASNPAKAETTSPMQSTGNATARGAMNVSSPALQNCGSTMLTAERFSGLFYAIASHGTLLDIPFIERTLNVRLNSTVATQSGGQIRKLYQTNSIFGAPIKVSLDVNESRDQIAQHFVGIMRFDFGPFADCLQLRTSELNSRFTGKFIDILLPDNFVETGSDLGLPGNDGSRIGAGYTYRNADKVIIRAAINQNR